MSTNTATLPRSAATHNLLRMAPPPRPQEQGSSVKYMPAHGPGVPDMRCPDTGAGYLMGGPLWAKPIHDHGFVRGLLAGMEADRDR